MAVDTDILPGRYRGARPIRSGGMGDVYRATDSVLGRAVAVKVLAERYAQDADIRERFTREALAAARLSGEPHTVTIFDVGEHRGRPYIVMEYLGGGSLEDVVREQGAVDPARALDWLEDAAHALDAAHEGGIVHRDVKPANLLLDRNGNVHVADFGIATAAGLHSLTKPGTILGTAGYLSPEQAQGEPAGPAADRYALAVVAFELLTGKRPFAADTATAEAMAHATAPVPDASTRNPDLPRTLDDVFRRALAKDPRERHGSCGELVAELRAALVAAAAETQPAAPLAPVPTPPAPVPVPRPLARPERRGLNPLLLVVPAALLAAGALLAALLARGGEESSPPAPTPPPRTVVTTIVTTTPATTQRVTVTAEQPTTAPTTTRSSAGGGGSVADGIALTDEATGLIREGRYEEALPVAQRALEILDGSGHIYEAYASYDVGKSLLELGRCAEALPFFDRSEAIQGPRKEIDRDRRAAERCA